MWLEAQHLFSLVEAYATDESPENAANLISQLPQFKERLQFITRNKAKSASDLAKLKPGTEIEMNDLKVELDDSICNETKIISNTFNMNELDALQVVLAGEMQMANFAGLPRGLLAVVCYYDVHRFLAISLQTMLKFDPETLPDDLRRFIETNIADVQVFKHLLIVQSTFSVASQFALLTQPDVNGLGGTRHQTILRTVVEELCESVSECLYSLCSWGADKAKDFAAELYPILKAVPVAEKFTSGALSAWICLVRISSQEILTRASSAAGVLTEMVREIRNETLWSCTGVCGTVQLACAVAIRAMAVSPADLAPAVNVEVDVDKVFNRAVDNSAIMFIRKGIIASEFFSSSMAFIKVVDTLFKQLICHFPAKLMEIERNSEDELNYSDEVNAKGQKFSPSRIYANFLGSISDIYFLIDSPRFSEAKKDELVTMSSSFNTAGAMELCRFLERSRVLSHPVHVVHYLELERSVCRTPETAAFLYDIFARVPANQDVYIGWEQFMSALRTYEQLYRQAPNATQFGGNVNASSTSIPPQELAGLVAWIKLATKISELDEEAADTFAQEPNWAVINCCCGLIASPVPLELKGALLSFLSSLAIREAAMSRIWHSLQAHQICFFSETRALCGLQQELEERECAVKKYDTTLGMVNLLKALLSHGTAPEFAEPYIQFLTKSVISQMRSRSYENSNQLWEIAEKSLDTVYCMIRNSYTDMRAVAEKDPHVYLLTNILNDTPVHRAICDIFAEDCDAYINPSCSTSTRLSQTASLSALRLLSLAVSRHGQLRSAIRSCTSDIIITNLQVLLLNPFRPTGESILDILFLYLDQVQELPRHAFYAAQILRELCGLRPSLQKKMTDLLKMRIHNGFNAIMGAVGKVLDYGKVQYMVDDVMVSGVDESDGVRCRGETARLLLEILSDSIDTDPSGPNLCFLLFGFQKTIDGRLFSNATAKTGFHSVIALIESFEPNDPFNKPYSALFEPAFRLLKRLVSLECAFSTLVLRYLRSNQFVIQILESGNLINCLNQFDLEECPTKSSLARMIVGSILHLAAIEISCLLKNGQLEMPSRLYKNLLDEVAVLDETTMDEEGNKSNILFSILRNSRKVITNEVEFTPLEHFNSQKLQIISQDCKTTTSFGIPQYDIEGLHELLKREISSTQNEAHIITVAETEMTQVLGYFTDLNKILLLRGAVDTVVSGCTAVLNVIALFSPVPFFSTEAQFALLCDAAFTVIEFGSDCTEKSSVPLCATLQRLSKAICALAKEEYAEYEERRIAVGKLFVPMLEFLVLPNEKPFQSKIYLYESLRKCLKTCHLQQQTRNEPTPSGSNWLAETGSRDDILDSIERVSYELTNRLVTDIGDMPLDLKVHPLLFLSDVLFEDAKGAKKVAAAFSKSGMPRYIVDLLQSIEIDWTAHCRRDVNAQIAHRSFNTILVLLLRLSLTDPGWTVLSELGTPEILATLPILVNPPKEIFLKPESVNQEGSPAQLFASAVGLVICFCLTLCSKPRWKRLSFKILEVVRSVGEILSQLMRAEIRCDVVKSCADLVHYIWECDDASRKEIDTDPLLNLLRNSRNQQQKPSAAPSGPVAFNAPTSLLRTLFAPAV